MTSIDDATDSSLALWLEVLTSSKEENSSHRHFFVAQRPRMSAPNYGLGNNWSLLIEYTTTSDVWDITKATSRGSKNALVWLDYNDSSGKPPPEYHGLQLFPQM